MGGQYSGAWRRTVIPVSKVPLKPGIDPEHARPADTPDPNWTDGTGAPQLPTEWSSGQYLQDNVPSAYSDQTPVDHTIGLGFLPGVTQAEAAQLGGSARSQDFGASDVRDYKRPNYQEDGSTHGVIVNTDLQGASPADLKYDEKGVGVGLDPYARSNTHITHRPTGPATYDMRWWNEQMRPRYAHNAVGSKVAPAVPNRTQLNPDSGRGTILRPDNWAAPVLRRSNPGWDQPATTDDTTQAYAAGGDFGLGSWGL
jgi:hypothetical protein